MFKKSPFLQTLTKTVGHILLAIVAYILAIVMAGRVITPLVLTILAMLTEVKPNEIQLHALKGLANLLCIGLAYFAYVKYFEKRQAVELAFSGRYMLLGLFSGAVLISITSLSLFAMGYYQVVSHQPMDEMLFALIGLMTQAITGEVLFRGVFFRLIERNVGSLYSLVVVSVLLGLLNILNDGLNLTVLVATILISALWCSVYILSRNLWVVGLFVGGWLYAVFLTGILDEHWRASAPVVSSYNGPVWFSGGQFGPEASVITIVVVAVSLSLVLGLAKRQGCFVGGNAPRHSD